MFGLAEFKGVVGSVPPMTHLFQFDLGAALSASMATVVFTLFFVDFFDTAGTLTSVANVSGKIDSKGKIVGVQARAPHPRLQKEAERVVNMLPSMTPGKQRGKAVGVLYSLPIVFQVQD